MAVASSLLYIHRYMQLLPKNGNWTITSYFLLLEYLITSTTFTLSVIYHTFMCHNGGKVVYDKLLKIDVAGVWLLATFGSLPMMYTTFYLYPGFQFAVILAYFGVSIMAMLIIVLGNSRQHRAIAMGVQYSLRLFVLGCRLSPIAQGVPDNSAYYVILEVLNAFGVLVNVLHIPERWFPGSFDYVFNGHQLMHISTVVALYVFKTGFIMDIEWLNYHVDTV